jgi:hypothetical protein
MSAPRPLEQALLQPAERFLERRYPSRSARTEVLEAAASAHGSFDLAAYRTLRADGYELDVYAAIAAGAELLQVLRQTPIHPALALSALARPELSTADQRKLGAYYTDFRLASYLASTLPRSMDGLVVDPACGTGILLVALTLHVCGSDRRRRASFLSEHVCGADKSDVALRGAMLALASLTDDIEAISRLHGRLRRMDSLVEGPAGWSDVAPNGFAVAIANPPWEKLKVSRHEYLQFNGHQRHYGADYDNVSGQSADLERARHRMARYTAQVTDSLALQGGGEADLYKLFLELCLNLASDAGHLAVLVPAGLLRSNGTAALRTHLLAESSKVQISVLHNRARFFAIDTRFKFLTVTAQVRASQRSGPIFLTHAHGTEDGISTSGGARIGRKTLRSLRPDLSVPEVRNDAEWRLFRRMYSNGVRLEDPDGQWQPSIVREVDMTNDRPMFRRTAAPGAVPVIEGRMVHQYRAGAKRYVRGTGRSAVWSPVPFGVLTIGAQFYMPLEGLRRAVADRIHVDRVGFCDITGQTNERSMLTALIPAGVVCGNKVPTVLFGGAECEPSHAERLNYLWLAIGNSLPFDWLLRRVVTTTVNFFLLLDLPVPALAVDSLPARRLIDMARQLTQIDAGALDVSPWEVGQLRARIDATVAVAYGATAEDVAMMLDDFPLLDRGQPLLDGHRRSTVTRDVLLAAMHEASEGDRPDLRERVALWRDAGAVPYTPAEYAAIGHEAAVAPADGAG